jgi:hypothetical protein
LLITNKRPLRRTNLQSLWRERADFKELITFIVHTFILTRWISDDEYTAVNRLGGDRLSHVLRRSIIGAEDFHGGVRDGIRCFIPRHSDQADQQPGHKPCNNLIEIQFHNAPRTILGGVEGLIKPMRRLVLVSFTHYCASTPGLSTWWSSTALNRDDWF